MFWGLHIKGRQLEWLIASYTLVYGYWIGGPGASLTSPSFVTLLRMMPEQGWANLFSAIGIVHLTALIINGSAWWTPFVRAAAAAINLFAYALITWGIYQENPDAPGVPTYGWLICGALIIVLFRAARDSFALLDASHGTL